MNEPESHESALEGERVRSLNEPAGRIPVFEDEAWTVLQTMPPSENVVDAWRAIQLDAREGRP
ncbi:hypothetical protein [Amycolatopsis sp. TNS106]|uniref:hypothetical protein n=1 Tax=Amycolatopsis sp. TNS106 TaxID=2861750 RepID=UPI001C55E3ED|nr:hypothetical protein [Amycolatopsis sp. TNS106]QXV63562.1 hypothetical protein CVV72_41105 [Amycolatopsis sp. TNS106]